MLRRAALASALLLAAAARPLTRSEAKAHHVRADGAVAAELAAAGRMDLAADALGGAGFSADTGEPLAD